jgi:hypothetical protein
MLATSAGDVLAQFASETTAIMQRAPHVLAMAEAAVRERIDRAYR